MPELPVQLSWASTMLQNMPAEDVGAIARTLVGTAMELRKQGQLNESAWDEVERRGLALAQDDAHQAANHERLMQMVSSIITALPEEQRAPLLSKIVDAVCALALRPPGDR